MRRKINYLLMLGVFSLLLISGCKKDDPDDDLTVLPTVETADIQALASSYFAISGVVISDKGATITSKGVCWSTNPDPTINDNKTDDGQGAKPFYSKAQNLEPNTTYYYRAYATSKKGTGYGNTYLVTTTELFVDGDGNKYETVKIGDQIWMMENLKTSKYMDGSSIPANDCLDYDNDPNNTKIYGKLYSSSINTDKLTPDGWRIPSDNDWMELFANVGGYYLAGGNLKETGTSHWKSPNTGAANSVDFKALPAGYALSSYYDNSNITFYKLNEATGWFNAKLSLAYELTYNSQEVDINYVDRDRTEYYSIRCVKN